MRWLIWILSAFLSVVVVAIALSFSLPAKTKLTRAIALKQTPEAVFTVLSDTEKFPTWNRHLEKIEMLPPLNGKEAVRQTFKNGATMTVVTTESLAPTHLVRSIRAVSGNAFSGLWTYDITPTNDGCEVALTQKSQVPSRLGRLMVWLSGSTKYIDRHLVDLARRFGEKPRIRTKRPEPRR